MGLADIFLLKGNPAPHHPKGKKYQDRGTTEALNTQPPKKGHAYDTKIPEDNIIISQKV